jgi:hypothetical protein
MLESAGGESENNCRDASSFRPPGRVRGDHVVGRAEVATGIEIIFLIEIIFNIYQ